MRTGWTTILFLAACSTPARAPVEAPAPEPAPAPVAKPAVVEQQTTIQHTDEAPAIGPVHTYAVPDATIASLARERVRGTVLVAGPLFPTDAAARSAVTVLDDAQQPIAMRVVADKGKVVQVTTSTSADCVEGFAQHYELTVFVTRASLVPRTTTEIAKAFDDGTAYAIDRGAPVRVTSAGAAWFDPMLDQTAAAPPDRLAYSLAKPYAPAVVPQAPGERMVCDAAPMTQAEYKAKQQAIADRAAAKSSAATRRATDLRAQTRMTAKTDSVDGLVDLALSSNTKNGDKAALPYCTVDAVAKPLAGRLGGAQYAWSARASDKVYRADQSYLADVGATCARVRVTVDPATVKPAATPETNGPVLAHPKAWIPKPGPVYWPDGSKAGKYTGTTDRYLRVDERAGMICVDVAGVAEMVCHRTQDVTVQK